MIHEIRIQNFKSIADVTVELAPVTVLVGRSGTGKSNFVEAIRLLRDLLNGRSRELAKEWSILRPVPTTESPTRFDIRFSVPGVDEDYHYSLEISKTGIASGPTEESLMLGDETLFRQTESASSHHAAKWEKEPNLVAVPAPGAIALGRMPSLSDVVIAFAALTDGIGCYTFPNSIMLNGALRQPVEVGLDDSASNYLHTMKMIVSNFQDLGIRKNIVAALQRVNDGVSSIELNDLKNPTHAIVGHKFGDRMLGLKLSQESEGFRRFFAHLLALYQRPPKLSLLFEHPEDGIHPGALSLLAEEFQAAPTDERGQVIITTHSPGLLDQFSADQIRVVTRDGFQTRIGPLASEQRDALNGQLTDPGELLTVDPARLESEMVGE